LAATAAARLPPALLPATSTVEPEAELLDTRGPLMLERVLRRELAAPLRLLLGSAAWSASEAAEARGRRL
jgi:hypothetical protein